MSGVSRLPGRVSVVDDQVTLAGSAADWILDAAAASISASGRFTIALAGGGTPRRTYQALAAAPRRQRADWAHWEIFFGDERAVPPDQEGSNYRLACETLLDHVPIPAAQVHRMEAERADFDAACAEYGRGLAAACPALDDGGAPRLDCVLLGIGENGHTASLFPGEPALDVRDRWVVHARADYPPHDRMTLTFPVLNAAARVAFLVAGTAKQDALRGVVVGTAPAAGVRPQAGELRWFLDAEAAAGL